MNTFRIILHITGIIVSASIAALTTYSNGGDLASGMAIGGTVNTLIAAVNR